MNTVYLRRSDETVNSIIKAAFPGYTGTKVTAQISNTVRFYGTQWDEGTKRDYVIVRIADLETMPVAQSPFFQRSDYHEADHEIPPGYVVVVHEHCRGGEYLTIISPADNITPLLESPAELTEDEKTVLGATRSLKSSYAGISNYRFVQAKERTGITLERWEAAKASLIGKKFLNKAGAITVEGRNAIGNYRL